MADSAVSFVLGRLGDFLVREAGVLKEVGNDVVLFRDKLQWLHTFVQHADHRRRRDGNAYMDVWVQQTREVALDVEDVLDEFMLRANMEQELPTWKKWLKFLSACATQISVRRELSGRIAIIRARLDQISDHRNLFFKEREESSAATRVSSPSISTIDGWNDELEMVGFEDKRLSLEHLLVEGDKRRSIVSIVGESGIGKSSLAGMVFKSHVVHRHFQARAILNLPPCIAEADAVYHIYKCLCSVHVTAKRSSVASLCEYLRDKSYLVVAAGASKLFNWRYVLDSLPDNELGSRIVIINSFKQTEASFGGLSVHELRVHPLDQENSNLLFCRHALGKENQQPRHGNKSDSSSSEYKATQMDQACKDSIGSEYEQMGQACKDMFEITSGLPLAILLLGRLLRRKEFPKQWTDVLKQLMSMKPSSRLQGILALSFDDLPHHLKSCFLYFAMMPPNMVYSATTLVRMWAAEGFLKPRKGQSIEEVGDNYLKELISRGMVNLVEKGPGASEESAVKRVDIHERLHAMGRFETQEGSSLDICDSTDAPSSTAVRHLYIKNLTATAYTHMEDVSFPKLRSISCDFLEYWEHKGKEQQSIEFGDSNYYHYRFLRHLGRSKLLRVMSLHGLRVKKLPHVIGSLIHLRYLCIQESSLEELPSTIANLINLQTLDIKETKVLKLTPAFWMIPTLRHVLAKHLHLPKSFGVLKNMQSLVGVLCVHPWHNNISPLHKMVNIRELEISSKLTSKHWDVLEDAFKQLDSLTHLCFGGIDIPFTLFTKFSLRRLQNLEMHRNIVMPTKETEERWSLPNLTKLVLQGSSVNQEFIDKAGKLPSLAELVLSNEAYVGEELVFSSGFGNLTHLWLLSLPKLLKWKIGPESLPQVQQITIQYCTKMRLWLTGEQVLENLKEFMVIRMPESWGVKECSVFNEKLIRIM
ncbi:hypothetical protein ACP4OV_013648 [Aristida adscensionis]